MSTYEKVRGGMVECPIFPWLDHPSLIVFGSKALLGFGSHGVFKEYTQEYRLAHEVHNSNSLCDVAGLRLEASLRRLMK